jgi:hypothetical protein
MATAGGWDTKVEHYWHIEKDVHGYYNCYVSYAATLSHVLSTSFYCDVGNLITRDALKEEL